MGRNRIPSAVQELKGAYRKDPQRRRKSEPKPKEKLGSPPESFTEEETAVFEELRSLAPWLMDCDLWLAAFASKLKAKADREGDPDCKTCEGLGGFKHDKGFTECPRCSGLSNTELTQFVKCLSLMGITPVDRSKVSDPSESEEENDFAEFAENKRPN